MEPEEFIDSIKKDLQEIYAKNSKDVADVTIPTARFLEGTTSIALEYIKRIEQWQNERAS